MSTVITKAFTGVNLAVQIGLPGTNSPTAVYATTPTPTTDGLKVISSITNEPASLLYLPSTSTSDLHLQKSSERKKFHGNQTGLINLNQEAGEVFETAEGIMGNITLTLAKNATGTYYNAAIDKLIRASTESNRLVYVKMERYIGIDTVPTPNVYTFHTKAALCLFSVDNNTVDAQAKQIEQSFKLEGFGEWIEGYTLISV